MTEQISPYSRRKRIPTNRVSPSTMLADGKVSCSSELQKDSSIDEEYATEKCRTEPIHSILEKTTSTLSHDRQEQLTEETSTYSRRKRIPTDSLSPT
jgi:hypothetical protein